MKDKILQCTISAVFTMIGAVASYFFIDWAAGVCGGVVGFGIGHVALAKLENASAHRGDD